MRSFCGFLLVLCSVAVPTTPFAADASYPTRPIRVIVPFAPGGSTDVIARIVAQNLTDAWGQQVIVDNRAGAGGNLGMGLAANAAPDGYTLLTVSSSFVVNPTLYAKAPYDPFKTFVPISNIAAAANVFTAHASQPVKSMPELIELVKKNPRKYNIGTPGVGTTPDLSAELLRLTTGIDIVRVPYKGAGPAVAAVAGNQVPFACTVLPPLVPHIKAGRLRGLAVTTAKRSSALPDVPTMAEAGVKGQEADTFAALLVPAGTPKPIIDKLSAEVQRIVAEPKIRARIVELGFEVIASTPDQFAAQIKAEVAKWGKVIRSANMQIN